MKIQIGIDCTSAEAREFFGLPDVKPLQKHLLQDIEEHLRAGLRIIDINNLLKILLPSSLHGLEKVQSALWSQFMGGIDTASECDSVDRHSDKHQE